MVFIKREKGKTKTDLLCEGQSINLPLKLKACKGTSVPKRTASFRVCSLHLQCLGSLTLKHKKTATCTVQGTTKLLFGPRGLQPEWHRDSMGGKRGEWNCTGQAKKLESNFSLPVGILTNHLTKIFVSSNKVCLFVSFPLNLILC